MNGGGVTPSPTPTPIAVEGAVQVFKDQLCTEYVTGGPIQEVYVRLNRAFGYGDQVNYGNPQRAGSSLDVWTPTDASPSNRYSVGVYVDLTSESSDVPFEAGQVIKCSAPMAFNVNNPQTVFGEL